MIVAGSANPLLLASAAGGGLTKSVRLRSSASAYLNRTPASAGSLTTWTYSLWIKRGALSIDSNLLMTRNAAQNYTGIYFDSSNRLAVDWWVSGTNKATLTTTQVFRDPSAWYHIVVAIDSTNATSSNRIKMYVNGVQITAFGTATYPPQNEQTIVNQTIATWISSDPAYSYQGYFDGYMTEVNFIDGQALTPSSFGSTSATTGVWQPKAYTGTYGTNGFYLPFTDNSALTTSSNVGLGKDFSGNGNYWATNNISITSGVTYDSMTDVPTLTSATAANYCVMNPLAKNSSLTVQDGNLYCTSSSSNVGASGTLGVSTGKWYWEATRVTGTTGQPMVGIVTSGWDLSYVGSFAGGYAYDAGGNKYNNATATAYGATYTAGDVIGIALDLTAGTITFYKNNTSQGVAFSGLSGEFFPAVSVQNNAFALNFGQQGFKYTPPTGFVALNTFNLPTPTIGATASTQANKYFDVNTWTGTGATNVITNSGSMQPDFVWIKGRSNATYHMLTNAVTGPTKYLYSNDTLAEATWTDQLTSFDSTGFTLGVDTNSTVNYSGRTYVGWQWKANGGTGVTNTAGSITSTVSANTSSGFSVVTYTGTGANATVGHGLGVAPKMVIIKSRSTSDFWVVWQTALSGTEYLLLNSTNAKATAATYFNSTIPSSTVFSLGSDSRPNGNGTTYVAYCFSEIAGYSKFGSYTGNGGTDGPFVYCGFEPRFIMVKGYSSAGNAWEMIDTARSPYNEVNALLRANSSGAEQTSGPYPDILSNGFKPRSANGYFNDSGVSYIFMAFAESPFKYSNAR